MKPSMTPSCSSPVIRFTTLVKPNTAYTGGRGQRAAVHSKQLGDGGQELALPPMVDCFKCVQQALWMLPTRTNRTHLRHPPWDLCPCRGSNLTLPGALSKGSPRCGKRDKLTL